MISAMRFPFRRAKLKAGAALPVFAQSVYV